MDMDIRDGNDRDDDIGSEINKLMLFEIIKSNSRSDSESNSESCPNQNMIAKDRIAELLKTSPEALEKFEAAYKDLVLDSGDVNTGNLIDIPHRQFKPDNASGALPASPRSINISELTDRIVDELREQTEITSWDGDCLSKRKLDPKIPRTERLRPDDINGIPENIRPQLAGYLLKRDTPGPSYPALLFYYDRFLNEKNPLDKKLAYHHFRQGLDILDLDIVLYEMLQLNKNSIGYWFPALCAAIKNQDLLKIPKTKIAKIPISLLQLTRLDYASLNPVTLSIVDTYCMEAFDLDTRADYFVKTGVYSSKFDFRNARVTGPDEIRTLGEYLLFIHFQSVMMAGPLSSPSIYGAATTNEWVVREFIPDTENDPCIYKGLPLRTEYRVFIDIDDNSIIGVAPYWDPETMKKRFNGSPDSDSNPHLIHDGLTYAANEERLMRRYEENKARVCEAVKKIIPGLKSNGLCGQWSLDVMQSGQDFYAIDMALAENSALIQYVPKNLLKASAENWIPELNPDEKKGKTT